MAERAGAANPHAFGTFVMPPACAGDHAKSKWGYLTGDVRQENTYFHYNNIILLIAAD
jgi:hypothetical protein